MKNALADILNEARKYFAEKQSKYLDSLTPEQLEAIAKRQDESSLEEKEEVQKGFNSTEIPKYYRNYSVYRSTQKLISDGFSSDEARLISFVTYIPEDATPLQIEQAAELEKRGPVSKETS
jgi:hypothetical protein